MQQSKNAKSDRSRGRWRYELLTPTRSVSIDCEMTCSVCGRKISRLHGWNFNFCPMCGADMREETEQ